MLGELLLGSLGLFPGRAHMRMTELGIELVVVVIPMSLAMRQYFATGMPAISTKVFSGDVGAPTHHNVGGEYEQGEGGADPNDEGADWGDNTDREDTTVGPCETPSATTTRDRSGKPWNEEDEKNTRATETKGAGHFEDDILGEHDARPCATPSASKKDDTKGTGDLVDDTLREHTKRPCETPSASKEKPTPPGQEERRGGYRTRQSSQRRERPHGEQKANKPKGEDTREHRRDEPQKPRRDEDEYEEVAVDPEDVTKAETENSGGTTTGRLRPAEVLDC